MIYLMIYDDDINDDINDDTNDDINDDTMEVEWTVEDQEILIHHELLIIFDCYMYIIP